MWRRDEDPPVVWLVLVMVSLLVSFAVLAGGCVRHHTNGGWSTDIPWFNGNSVTSVNGVPYRDGRPVQRDAPTCAPPGYQSPPVSAPGT